MPPALPPSNGIDLQAALDRSRALVASVPDPDSLTVALADSLEDDPMAAFAWVRDSIGFDPYSGELRGAGGTFAARAGNSVDRALLLQKLLTLMAVPTRLAHATLDTSTATQLVQRSFQQPAKPLAAVALDEAETGPFDSLAARAQRDYSLLRNALGDRVSTMDGSSNADAIQATKDHWWVEMASGADWIDLDPSMPDAQPGQTLAPVEDVVDALPDSEQQTVTIRVLAEILSGGQLNESPVLDQTLSAADAGSSELYLAFEPAGQGLGSTISQALGSATSWEPVLYVGDDQVIGSAFPVTAGKDLFSATTEDGPQFSRLRLEVVVNTPG